VDWHIVLIWGKAQAFIAKLARWKNNYGADAMIKRIMI
jgi:hypothetical protein